MITCTRVHCRGLFCICTAFSILALVTCSVTLNTCAFSRPQPALALAPTIRVQLVAGEPVAEFSVAGAYKILSEDGVVLAEGPRLAPGQVVNRQGKLQLNGVSFEDQRVVLQPAPDELVELGDQHYRGQFEISTEPQDSVAIANVLDIEDYLVGVLFAEMPAYFPEAALQAQAVAARSYARFQLQQGVKLLQPTESHQMYVGEGSTAAQARRIVESTRGLVVEYHGQPLCTLYSSTCGGATASNHLAFGTRPEAPLQSVPCNFCSESPLYRWRRQISVAELSKRLGIEEIQAMDLKRDSHGRVVQIRFQTKGPQTTFSALKVRAAWNAGRERGSQLPSAFFREVGLNADRFEIHGAGFGHGVGMCQYGAGGLAKRGKHFREILQYYYRGAEIVKRW